MKRILVYTCMLALSIQAVWAIILPNGSDVIISAIKKYDSGAIRSVTLAEDAAFTTQSGTFTFKSGSTVTFHENGNVESGYLNDRIAEFYENGFLKKITPETNTKFKTKYGDLVFLGEKYASYTVEFYDNGFVKSGQLKDKQHIKTSLGTIECKKDYGSNETHFYENGGIQSIDIYPFEVATPLGKILVQRIQFDENERLTYVYMGYSGSKMPKGIYPGFEALSDFEVTHEVTFYENGTIKTARIDSDDWLKIPVGKIKIDSSVPVTFYENGTFKSAPIQPQVFDTPLGLLSITEIGIYPSGKIEYINLASAVTLPDTYTMYAEINEQGYGNIFRYTGRDDDPYAQEKLILKCRDIHFYENGIIKQLSIDYDNWVSINIERDSYRINKIWFYEDGKTMGALISSHAYNYIYSYIIFAPDGEFLGRAVIDADTGLLREPTPEEDAEYERQKQRSAEYER
ncbi:MAG: hypothetical protein ACTTI3_06985 [Treponema sp.]